MSNAELITDLAGMQELAPEWDALAVAAPAWVLSWWRHVAPPDLEARVVAVRDGKELIGVAPFYVSPHRRGGVECRLMASEFGVCMEPLALPGREWEVAGQLGRVLASSRPRPDVLAFGPMTIASHWTTAVHSLWPGKILGVLRQCRFEGVPVIILRELSYELWFASLSAKFRHSLRRSERLFEAAGGTTRWTTSETLRADAEAFTRLHCARWEGRGSRFDDLGDRLPDWFEDLARDLIDDGRFKMCVLELDGAPICADFALIAGDELATVNTGWDERYAKLEPAKLAVLRVVRHAYESGCRRVHLGCGEKPNKLRFANGNDPAAWTVIMPPSPRLPKTYGHELPHLLNRRARDAAKRALPAQQL
jgi:CelD/BcsL family acetyltransferase involved in cellulose biosynthesis